MAKNGPTGSGTIPLVPLTDHGIRMRNSTGSVRHFMKR